MMLKDTTLLSGTYAIPSRSTTLRFAIQNGLTSVNGSS